MERIANADSVSGVWLETADIAPSLKGSVGGVQREGGGHSTVPTGVVGLRPAVDIFLDKVGSWPDSTLTHYRSCDAQSQRTLRASSSFLE